MRSPFLTLVDSILGSHTRISFWNRVVHLSPFTIATVEGEENFAPARCDYIREVAVLMAKSSRNDTSKPEGKKAALKRRTTKLYRQYEKEVKRSGIESQRLGRARNGTKPGVRDPLGKAKERATALKAEKEAAAKAKQEARKEREEKGAQRRRKARGLLKRSKKGQPLMRNMAKHLLEKVKKIID